MKFSAFPIPPDIRKDDDLIIRKWCVGVDEQIDDHGNVFDATPIDVEIIRRDHSFRIASLLPLGWRILESPLVNPEEGGLCALPGQGNYVAIPELDNRGEEDKPYLQSDFSLHFLLHEIGHAHLQSRYTSTELAEAQLIFGSCHGSAEALTEEEEHSLHRFVYRDERNAWAYAVRNLRMLRETGIDAESGTERRGLRTHIRECVGSYKEWLQKVGVQFGD